jgi:hypothetical protein
MSHYFDIPTARVDPRIAVEAGVPMPRQNRVNPFGEIIATSERGTFMGNRGVLHDEESRIRRKWLGKRWLVCVLEFRDRKRTVMSPRHYTELFFLDEATALAAGHRPCAECRRERFNAFRSAWQKAHPPKNSSQPTASEIDTRLHSERVSPEYLFVVKLAELPNGVFVKYGEGAFLIYNDWLLAWSAGGYTKRLELPHNSEVIVLTPKSTVETIRAGYVPEIHTSANHIPN